MFYFPSVTPIFGSTNEYSSNSQIYRLFISSNKYYSNYFSRFDTDDQSHRTISVIYILIYSLRATNYDFFETKTKKKEDNCKLHGTVDGCLKAYFLINFL